MRRLSTFFLILLTLSLVGCDHVTKEMAAHAFQEQSLVFFSGLLEFTYAENRDMAFGLLAPVLGDTARLWLLTSAKVVAVLGGTILWIMRRRVSSLTERLGLAMALSGALGNLIDRLVRGYVVDFVKVPHWPVFNVADIAIVLGFALLIVEGHRHAPERTLGS